MNPALALTIAQRYAQDGDGFSRAREIAAGLKLFAHAFTGTHASGVLLRQHSGGVRTYGSHSNAISDNAVSGSVPE